ncbi:hypothetical protein [Bernardetia sp.]|uniref:hypothetical protein n=1 Tax=Bernardetia sp. TaxID=1937974 RepID=UPI0025C6E3AE|nr:hypothetical protein [Bernardetia sp.]
MKIVKVIFASAICFFCLTLLPHLGFAQLDKEACKEILSSLDVDELRQVSIITHVLTTDSSVHKPNICLLSPLLKFEFRESYLIVENDRMSKTSTYLPYNKIKFITISERGFNNKKVVEIHLMD